MMRRIAAWLTAGLVLVNGMAYAGTVTYIYTDPQGTPLAEADAQGNITARFDYTPYGRSVPGLGVPPNGPGYTGHMNDPDTGLVYMQARYYDPEVGRFLSADPVGVGAGNLFSFTRYGYANDNPIVNYDPDGRDTCPGSTSGSCKRADTWTKDRSKGQTYQVSPPVASSATQTKAQIQTTSAPEKGGYLVQSSDGKVKFQLSTNAVASKDSKHNRLTLGPIPQGAVAVVHSHIDGDGPGHSKGLQSDGDAAPLKNGLPNIAESKGRFAAWELVGGRLQVRMLEGKMTHAEQVDIQRDLNVQQEEFLSH